MFIKVSRRLYNVIFNVLVAVIMSIVMSLALTVLNAGIPPGFWGMWLKSFFMATAVSIPVTFATIPLVTKILRFLEIK